MSEGFARKKGDRVGPYTLVEPVGRGGFSEVWRAESVEGSEVALKLLIHPEHVGQLRKEADALALVRGPGIVPILGMGLADDPPWIALRLLEGGNLRRRMRDGAIDPTTAILTFEAILEVLARVHGEGIVHGDLKPENVLFTERHEPYLADFGLSRRITQRSASLSVSLSLEDTRLAGTLDYMAPEQRAGEKPTARSDVFAAGVLLYELLTGERPQGVFKMPSEIEPSMPPVVDRLIACSLAQDPRHRFASAAPMLAFLRSGLTSDWQDLARAQKRLEGLARLSAAGQAQGFDTSVKAAGIAIATMAFMLGTAGTFSKTNGLLLFLVGAFTGGLLVWLVARLLRPWLVARYEVVRELKTKVELQIRTGGEGSRAASAAAKRKPIVGSRAPARPVPRTGGWSPPRPAPSPAGVNAGRGLGGLFVGGLIVLRACAAANSHSTPPYYPSPPPYYAPPFYSTPATPNWGPPPPPFAWPTPTDVPPSPTDIDFTETRERSSEESRWIASWKDIEGTGRLSAVAVVGSLIYAASDQGVVWSLDANHSTRRCETGERAIVSLAAGGGRIAVATAGAVLVYDEDGSKLATVACKFRRARSAALAVSPDGEHVAYETGGGFEVLSVETGRPRRELLGPIAAIAFEDAEHVVVLGATGKLLRVSVKDEGVGAKLRPSPAPPLCAALSANGRWVVSQMNPWEVTVADVRGRSTTAEKTPRAARLVVSDDGERVLLVDTVGALHLAQPGRAATRQLVGRGVVSATFVGETRLAIRDSEGRVILREIER